VAKVAITLPNAMKRAAAAYQQGHHDEAERFCRAVLRTKADHFDALHLLGIVLSRLGQKDEGLACLERALVVKPLHADALNNRGMALQGLNRFEEALASYDRALTVRPDYAEALSNRGNTLKELKRFEEALASFDRAIELRPDYAEAHFNRGLTLKEMKRLDKALASFDRALAAKPDYVEALTNRGNVLRELKRHEEALACLDRALSLRPEYAVAHNIRGIVLKELKRLEESLANYNRAIALRPDFAEAYNNRGNMLQQLRRPEEALTSYDRALALRSDYVEAYNNRGNTLLQLRRPEEALADYAKAIALRPDNAEAHFNEACCRLLIRDFDRGWEKYEWRWETVQLRNTKRNITQPLWLDQKKIAGKTILLHAEQGLGDTIQFCRYARLVAEQGADVILHVQPPLKRLMSGIAGPRTVLSHGEIPPPFDLHCPLLSLPLAFGTRLDTIPPCDYRMYVPPQLMQQWESKLGPKTKPRVGIVWSGAAIHKGDHNRSIPLHSLLGLLKLPIQIVSLQKELHGDDQSVLDAHKAQIAHFGPVLTDFSDTAALASLMDVVVSVDTSVAHLAGALGRPTWILLPYIPDWRWLLDREDSPWYPTVRLFRQASPGEWGDVIARVASALSEFAAGASEAKVPRMPDQVAVNRLSRG
jgi:tetratricopeptide (TPR) repeat protein